MTQIFKYPRTQHIEGSRLQPGDEDMHAVKFEKIAGRNLVVEEKVDGANCGISFASDGRLQLQSRGHYLTGGAREKHFSLFKQWATTIQSDLFALMHDRYVVYGEWLYAKHTIFYDCLPHYFLEFDILDLQERRFLDTPSRREFLGALPIHSVPILHEGVLRERSQLRGLIGTSQFIQPGHLERLRTQATAQQIDVERVFRETAKSEMMEGLYIKVEERGEVIERYKFVRVDFLTAVFAAEGHWLNRAIVPNQLAKGVELFGTHPTAQLDCETNHELE